MHFELIDSFQCLFDNFDIELVEVLQNRFIHIRSSRDEYTFALNNTYG
jgi:hypothetical protein